MNLPFGRLTKAAVASSFYMSSVAKVRFFLHIPILFADYLMDSYQFQSLKGSTSCYFMRIICLFHSLTPSLSPSPARGIFRLGDMVLDVSFRLMCFVHSLPSFNLKAHSYVNSQTMNQLATVIIPTGIKRINKVCFITYRSQHPYIWCNMHFNANAG